MHDRAKIEISNEEQAKQLALLEDIKGGYAARFLSEKGRAPLFWVVTYGCQMNEHDSEHISGMLKLAGFKKAGDQEGADLILFNTCCVREHAEMRVFGNIGALRKLKEARPELMIGVCGCMMQQEHMAKKLFDRFPFVDMVFGTHNLYTFPELLKTALEGDRVYDVRHSEGNIAESLPSDRAFGASAFVSIMYGCNNFCSYCIVPYVRGRERSRRYEDIAREIDELASSGCKEVTLLGQNVNSYGKDLEDGLTFAGLLRKLDERGGIERIRFMTSHPKDLSPELIDAMAECKSVCKHIHLPVQSGSSTILAAMNRRYTSERYLELLGSLRARIPGIQVTSDIIVGFPGETEDDFLQTLELVKKAGFSTIYSFMYSPREGTPAAKLAQLGDGVKKERLQRLNAHQAQICKTNNEVYIGNEYSVLVEGCDEEQGRAYGKTDNFKTIYFDKKETKVGDTVRVKVQRAKANSLIGEIT